MNILDKDLGFRSTNPNSWNNTRVKSSHMRIGSVDTGPLTKVWIDDWRRKYLLVKICFSSIQYRTVCRTFLT